MNESKGRPSRIFETERIEEFLQLIQDGVDFNVAADSSQFARSTVFEWLKKGREIQQNSSVPTELNEKDLAYLDFLERFMRARAFTEVKAVETISKSINKGSWRAAAWLLEHRYPERWAPERLETKQANPTNFKDFLPHADLERKVEEVIRLRNGIRDA
jgi:hypothetical protein